MDQNVLDKLARHESLPTIPVVALEVLRLARSSEASVAAIAQVISRDPALSTRILRMANSSFFGAPIRATTVTAALVRMGLRRTQAVALTFSVVAENASAKSSGIDHNAFWRRSLITAVAAKTLEERTRCRRCDEAFTAGLLQDMGVLALMNCLKSDYQQVLDAQENSDLELVELENALLGANHVEAAGYLLGMWNIPDAIAAPISAHHNPHSLSDSGGEDYRMARILQTADALMRLINYGTTRENIARCTDLCRRHLGWPPTKLVPLVREIAPQVREVGTMLSIDVPTELLTNTAKVELERLVEEVKPAPAGAE